MVNLKINHEGTTARSEQSVNVNEVSRIAEGVVIKGDISSRSDIRVDGRMDGTLFSQGRIVVGESAVLKGNMLCSNVDFWGHMDGDIYVRDVLSLKSTAVVNGNIHVRKLQVEMGAQVNGTCRMISEAEFDKLAADVVVVKAEPAAKPAPKTAPVIKPAAAAAAPAAAPSPAAAPKEQPRAN